MRALFWLFMTLLIATAWHRSEHFDDAWFAEQAYWLVQDGVVRSELFRGLNGWEKQLFVFHKGFVYVSAAVQGLLGFSLPVAKAMGAVWTLVGGAAVALHMRRLHLARRWTYLALLIYVANGLLIEYTFVNRPEPMYMALGFISFSLLTQGRILVAGAAAGLAAFTHLNGLCYILAGLGWLLWTDLRPTAQTAPRQLNGWGLLRFGLAAGMGIGLYFADVMLARAWPTFWLQFTRDPATRHVTGLVDKLLISGKLHELLFHSEEEVALSVLALGVTLLTFLFPRKRPIQTFTTPPALADTGRYLLLLIGSFALITKSNTDYYYLIFLPVLCVWIAQCVAAWPIAKESDHTRQWRVGLFGVLLGVYLLAGVWKAVTTISWNLSQPNVADKNARIAALVGQPGSHVIAPLDFFYDQQTHYRIHGLSYFHLVDQKQYGGQMTVNQFFDLADADSAVAVISDYGRDFSFRIPKETPARVGRYRRVYQDELNAVYLRGQ